jgi:hypothetical protein
VCHDRPVEIDDDRAERQRVELLERHVDQSPERLDFGLVRARRRRESVIAISP